jgi:hypothetical protein
LKEILEMTKGMDLENLKQKMNSMKENGDMTYLKDKENSKNLMDTNIMENLKLDNIKDKEY